MRPRASGGMEPDDTDQKVLVEFWHISRVFGTDRQVRLGWIVDHFLAIHPDAGRKWVYVWCERYLGRLVDPDPFEGGMAGDQGGWPEGPTSDAHTQKGAHLASSVPKRARLATFVPKRVRAKSVPIKQKRRAK